MIILLSILSGILGRLGGWGQEGRDWAKKHRINIPDWVFDTKARDVGCMLCTLGAFWLYHMSWLYFGIGLVAGVMMLGALTTYFDFIFIEDNLWMHGFMIGLAMFPLVILTQHWWLFGIRCIALAIYMGGLNKLTEVWKFPDGSEEFLRYISLPVTVGMIV